MHLRLEAESLSILLSSSGSRLKKLEFSECRFGPQLLPVIAKRCPELVYLDIGDYNSEPGWYLLTPSCFQKLEVLIIADYIMRYLRYMLSLKSLKIFVIDGSKVAARFGLILTTTSPSQLAEATKAFLKRLTVEKFPRDQNPATVYFRRSSGALSSFLSAAVLSWTGIVLNCTNSSPLLSINLIILNVFSGL